MQTNAGEERNKFRNLWSDNGLWQVTGCTGYRVYTGPTYVLFFTQLDSLHACWSKQVGASTVPSAVSLVSF